MPFLPSFNYHRKYLQRFFHRPADPYASWQRGTNENTNGLIREFYPKKYNFSGITQDDLNKVVAKINNRPRRCLGYKTPNEVFLRELNKCCT